MIRLRTVAACAALVATSACAAQSSRLEIAGPERRPDRELRVRFLGRPSGGAAIWFATGEDGQPGNHRYEGLHLLVDPGTPEDVEALLPVLAKRGLSAPAYVLLTVADVPSRAGAERLRREFPRTKIVSAGNAGLALTLGLELNTKVLPAGPGALALRLQHLDRVFAIFPPGVTDEMVETERD